MNMLTNLKTDNSIEQETDSVGGGFTVLDSALYDFTVKLAYLGQAASKAMSLNLVLATDDGKELRQTLWMTSGEAKGCKNYYEKDGKKHYLPGFNMANALCLLTVGKEISDLDTEDKVIKLYNPTEGKEMPTQVPMLTDLLEQQITAGIIKQIVDKNVKNEASGQYEPSGETREENEVDKFFRHKDGFTVTEIRAQAPEAEFKATWEGKWTGEVKNKAKGKAAGGSTAGMPNAAASSAGKPTTSLFQ